MILASEVGLANAVSYLRSANCHYAFNYQYIRNGTVLRTSRVAEMCLVLGYTDFRFSYTEWASKQ